jgi:hypothetical protein
VHGIWDTVPRNLAGAGYTPLSKSEDLFQRIRSVAPVQNQSVPNFCGEVVVLPDVSQDG